MKFRVIVGIDIESADKHNAEMEIKKILEKKKIEGEVFRVEEA
jgi:hypothetical protein